MHALGCKSADYHTKVATHIREYKTRVANEECEYSIKLFGYNTCLMDLDFGAYEQDRTCDQWTTESWVEYESRHKPGCLLGSRST